MDKQTQPGLVDFFVIGQMRAGTTSLHLYLQDHPDIFMPEMKEARFFNFDLEDPERAQRVKSGFPVLWREYEAMFATRRDERLVGEASPQYIDSAHAAEQIKTYFPDAKIIASLREPAPRIYSLYVKQLDGVASNKPFLDAFREQRDDHFVQGCFTYRNLTRYYERFPAERIHLLRFEDLASSPHEVMRGVFNFLGVAEHNSADQEQVHNAGGVPKSVATEKIFRFFKGRSPIAMKIRGLLPAKMIDAAKQVRQANLEKPAKLTDEERQEVNAFYAEDTLRLQEKTGLDLSSWLPG